MDNEQLEILKIIKENHIKELDNFSNTDHVNSYDLLKSNSISKIKHPKKANNVLMDKKKHSKLLIGSIPIMVAVAIAAGFTLKNKYNDFSIYYDSEPVQYISNIVSSNSPRTNDNTSNFYRVNNIADGILNSKNVEESLVIAIDLINEDGYDNIEKLFENLNEKDPNFKYKTYQDFINLKGNNLKQIILDNMDNIIEHEKSMKGKTL